MVTKRTPAAVRQAAAPVQPPVSGPPAKRPAKQPAKHPPKVRQTLVRDGFTMPESDFALFAVLKARAIQGQREAKKSELLRAGLHALAAMDAAALVAQLGRLDAVKVGRPKKG